MNLIGLVSANIYDKNHTIHLIGSYLLLLKFRK